MPGATTSWNLHLLILDSPQYITLSNASQHSTRMRCYFHYQRNGFIDYFDDPVPDCAVKYTRDIPFWYDKQEGAYTELFGTPTGHIFLSVSRNHEFLLCHRGNASDVSCTPIASRKSNYNYFDSSHFSSITHMQMSSLNPSDPWHQTYIARKRDAQAEYLALIKAALQTSPKY